MVMVALATVLLKTVTDDLSFWHATALRSAGMSAVLLTMNLRPQITRDLARFMRAPRALAALGVDAGAATVAMILITFAISAGPVSLVNAVASASSQRALPSLEVGATRRLKPPLYGRVTPPSPP
jgi:hypothetical protein